MRVTDAMLARGVNAFVDAQPECALRHGSRAVLRVVLEAALADMEEPTPTQQMGEAWRRRALNAEAKLAKVREWARRLGTLPTVFWAILDGD